MALRYGFAYIHHLSCTLVLIIVTVIMLRVYNIMLCICLVPTSISVEIFLRTCIWLFFYHVAFLLFGILLLAAHRTYRSESHFILAVEGLPY